MEAVEKKRVHTVRDKLNMLSSRTKAKKIQIKKCKCLQENSVVNKELTDIQQNIYNTIMD